MSSSLPELKFLLLWTLASFFCSVLALAMAGFPQPVKIPFLLAYWVLLGIAQWRVLQPYVTWAYQWGLITTVSGASLPLLISLLFFLRLKTFPNIHEFNPFKLLDLANLLSILGSPNWQIKIIVAIFFGAIGIVLGFVQWLVLRLYVPQAGCWILANGFVWFVGAMVFFVSFLMAAFLFAIVEYYLFKAFGFRNHKLVECLVIAFGLAISAAAGSFLKGMVLVRLLSRLSG